MCFSRAAPEPLEAPKLVACSAQALELLGVPHGAAAALERAAGVDGGNESDDQLLGEVASLLSGTRLLPGAAPAAHCYCGHQFGHFSGQLGDGATMYLGECLNARGERWELQFKGAGPTLYSRRGDGRKVLRSSIREFLCSEHMHALGVPTTRAASLTTSDTRVARDKKYDGDVTMERASVITRVAPTFLRFGSFEIFRKRDPVTGMEGPSVGLESELLPVMLDYVAESFFPDMVAQHGGAGNKPAVYAAMLREVSERTGRLVAAWQCVGWCHGVLNTDNMSILGLTIDYGPFGFMDRFDPAYVCNASDSGGRYEYQSQPRVCEWNCRKLAEAWGPALEGDVSEHADAAATAFTDAFEVEYLRRMRLKLGLLASEDDEADLALAESFLDAMAASGADFTNAFRVLAQVPAPAAGEPEAPSEAHVAPLLGVCASAEAMARAAKPSLPEERLQMLLQVEQQNPGILQARLGVTPEYILGELRRHEYHAKLLERSDSDKAAEDSRIWTKWLKRYLERLQRDAESARDGAAASAHAVKRREAMLAANPRFILRNYVAEECIRRAEQGDYASVGELLERLRRPYDEPSVAGSESESAPAPAGAYRTLSKLMLDSMPPAWAETLAVS